MKKMLLLLTACAFSFATAQAQTSPAANGTTQVRGQRMGQGKDRTPEQRAHMQTQRLTRQLALSTDQQTKVRAIFLAQASEVEAARAQHTPGSGDRRALGQQMQQTRSRTDEQLKAVLTPEQYAKYAAAREERTENRQEKRAEMKKQGRGKMNADKATAG